MISTGAAMLGAIAAWVSAVLSKQSSDRSLQRIQEEKYADFVDWEAYWSVDEESGEGFVLFANVGDSPAKNVRASIRTQQLTHVGQWLDENAKDGVIEELVEGGNSEFVLNLNMEELRSAGQKPVMTRVGQMWDHRAHCRLTLYIVWEDSRGKQSKKIVSPEIN